MQSALHELPPSPPPPKQITPETQNSFIVRQLRAQLFKRKLKAQLVKRKTKTCKSQDPKKKKKERNVYLNLMLEIM